MTNTVFTTSNTMTLTNGGLTAKATSSTADYARSEDTKDSGKFYLEFKFDSSAGLGTTAVGLAPVSRVYSGATPQLGLVVGGNGSVYANSAAITAAALGAVATNDVICCAVDFGLRAVWFRKGAAGNWNNSATANPATGAGGLFWSTMAFLAPYVQFGNTTDQVTLNSGDTAFTGTVPTGFTSGWPTGSTSAVVSQLGAEVFQSGAISDLRVSQLGAEVWRTTADTTLTNYSITLGAGSFSLSGQAASLSAQRSIALAAGSLSLSGQAVSLLSGRRLSLDAGSYSLTGQPVSFAKRYSLAPGTGSYSLTGQSVGFSVLDRNFTDVVLLIGADGTNASTSFTDESPYHRTLVSHGGAQISTSSPLFGTGSILLDGVDDYISAATTSEFNLGGIFTVETNVRLQETTDFAIMGLWSATTANCSWLLFSTGGLLTWRFYQADGTLRNMTFAWTPTLGQDYHIAVSRNSTGKTRLRVDGVVVASNTSFAPPRYVAAGGFTIGFAPSSTYLFGRLDEVRVTNQKDRYDTDATITKPGKKFPRTGLQLVAEAGSLTLAGQALVFRRSLRIRLGAGLFSLSGNDLDLVPDLKFYELLLGSGSYSVTGKNVTLRASRKLPVGAGSFTISGQSASLRKSTRVTINAGSYSLTGKPVVLRASRSLSIGSGQFALSGSTVGLHYIRRIVVGPGAFQLTGYSANFEFLKTSSFVLGSIQIYPLMNGAPDVGPTIDGESDVYPAQGGSVKSNRWVA